MLRDPLASPESFRIDSLASLNNSAIDGIWARFEYCHVAGRNA